MVIFFHRFVIGYEERTLRRRFAYAGYVQRAPRRIPRPPRVAEPHPQMGCWIHAHASPPRQRAAAGMGTAPCGGRTRDNGYHLSWATLS